MSVWLVESATSSPLVPPPAITASVLFLLVVAASSSPSRPVVPAPASPWIPASAAPRIPAPSAPSILSLLLLWLNLLTRVFFLVAGRLLHPDRHVPGLTVLIVVVAQCVPVLVLELVHRRLFVRGSPLLFLFQHLHLIILLHFLFFLYLGLRQLLRMLLIVGGLERLGRGWQGQRVEI